jgi:hypothetical protein
MSFEDSLVLGLLDDSLEDHQDTDSALAGLRVLEDAELADLDVSDPSYSQQYLAVLDRYELRETELLNAQRGRASDRCKSVLASLYSIGAHRSVDVEA